MLTRVFDLGIIKRKLLFKKGAVMTVTSSANVETELDMAELAALNDIAASDLAKIDGITNGTAAASKALVVDASINLTGLNNLDMTGNLTVDGATGTGTATAGLLKLTTPETTVVDADQLGRIDFSAPLEASGTDAILVGASIWAEADDTFSATVNDTDLVFATGLSAAATEKMRLSSSGELTVTTAAASAFAVGLTGATNPAFLVDSSTASQAAGLKVTGAVAAGTVAVAVVSSGADANLTVNAKGTGTIGIGSVSTGAVTVTPAMTASGIVTFKTAHSGLIHGCGASGANHALGATGDNALEYYFDSTHTTGDMRGMYLRLYFSGAGGSGEAARIFGTINNVSVATGGTVNGAHISLGTAGASAAVSGAANALRATFGIAAATTALNGTCAVIQVDTDFTDGMNMPSNFAFLRFTNSGTSATVPLALFRVPNVAAAANGLFCAHVTDTMTHSLRFVSEAGTEYHIMCTTTTTNRTES